MLYALYISMIIAQVEFKVKYKKRKDLINKNVCNKIIKEI